MLEVNLKINQYNDKISLLRQNGGRDLVVARATGPKLHKRDFWKHEREW